MMEKRENTPEQLQAKRDDITKNIKVSMSRTSFGMPESVMQGAKRDIEYEKEKQDEVTQSALDNF